ncbi:malonyl-ACP O-methyltransferase BioC [Nitrincola sp. MINF-07-Sa-05]|uniref:malonyl-ACP O-methyltransferase BioC n=1 Tax=Nitrincola salilacus TaxID=3400273 RepID=UPI0039184D50
MGSADIILRSALQQNAGLHDDQLPGCLQQQAPLRDSLRDKRQVASSFSRAAASYDSVAGLQRDVADRLASWLPVASVERVLDLGSGTGYSQPTLCSHYPDSQLLSLDLAEGMLRHAREQRDLPGVLPVCGDAEQLPFADQVVDLIWSSLAIQWCQQPQELFRELWRVLRPGGRVLLSTLGPATLHELRYAWAGIDQDPHVNEFIAREQLLAHASAFTVGRAEVQTRMLEFDSLLSLMQELKALGAHNTNPRQRKGLGGRAVLDRLQKRYESFRAAAGSLPATYEIHYIELIKES